MFEGLAAIDEDITLNQNKIYTLVIKFLKKQPSISEIQKLTKTNLVLFMDIIDVSGPSFSDRYNIIFKFKKKSYPLGSLVNLIKMYLDKYPFTTEEFVLGEKPIPSEEIKTITGSILKTGKEAISATTSGFTDMLSQIKWIAIGGAVIVGVIYLSPFLRQGAKMIEKKES